MILAAMVLLTSTAAVAQNKVDKQGRKQGHWVRVDKDGSKIYEGDFKDGLETGTFTYYYHDGTVRIRNTYIEPGTVCQHEAYDEQGRLLAKGTYNRRPTIRWALNMAAMWCTTMPVTRPRWLDGTTTIAMDAGGSA